MSATPSSSSWQSIDVLERFMDRAVVSEALVRLMERCDSALPIRFVAQRFYDLGLDGAVVRYSAVVGDGEPPSFGRLVGLEVGTARLI